MKEQNNSVFLFKDEKYSCPKTVYFPSEDSYFLAENVSVPKNSFVIDLGCGSGIQSLNVLMQGASKVIAIDINEECLETTKNNCEQAGFAKKIFTLKSSLFENYSGEKADVIIFNPPYVISDEIKYLNLDGGKKGRETLDRFLKQFPKHLEKKGVCFFLQTDLNGYKETEKMLKSTRLKTKIVAKKKSFFEELSVYKSEF
ncbi:MAG: HemK2/MTQ2 family protein methyltransferase [Candidatus Diapherotrites archaeon]